MQTPLLGNALEFVLVPVSIFVRWFGGASRGLKWFPCEVYGKYDQDSLRGNHYRPSTPRNCCKDCFSEFKSWSLDFGAWILDLGIWIFDLGSCVFFWILKPESSVFWGLDFGVLILDSGFLILDLGDRGVGILEY